MERLSDNADPVGIAVEAYRHHGRQTNRLHAWQACQTIHYSPCKGDALLVVLVAHIWHSHFQRRQVIGLEAEFDMQQAIKTFSKESRTCQQHNSDRELHDHEIRAKATP